MASAIGLGRTRDTRALRSGRYAGSRDDRSRLVSNRAGEIARRLAPTGGGKPQRECQDKEGTQQFSHFLSPPIITTPIRTSRGIPQKVGAARNNKYCGGVYAGRVQKHKSHVCGNLPALRTKFWMQSIGLRKWTMGWWTAARSDVSYNRRPWKQFSIRFASWK